MVKRMNAKAHISPLTGENSPSVKNMIKNS